MANNYKVKMVDLQNKYKFKIFCSSQMYDDTELKREVETIYKAFPKASGTGTDASLDGTAAAIMNIDLKGNTSQNTTTGKNLFGVSDNSNTSAGVTITTSNNKVMFTGTPTRSYINTNVLNYSLPAGTYTISSTNNDYNFFLWFKDDNNTTISSANLYKSTKTITLSQAATKIQYGVETLTTGTAYNIETYFQVESGSTATDYEPYTGGTASPNPSYPQDVNVVTGDNIINICGKNLAQNIKGYVGATYTSGNGECFVFYGNTNQTYRWNCSATTNRTVLAYSGVFPTSGISVERLNEWGKGSTFTATKDGWYIFYVNNALDETIKESFIINKGTTQLPYEPYQGASYSVNLGSLELCKLGDYQDYIYKENKKWYKHCAIQKYDAWETISYSQTHTVTNTYQFALPLPTTVSLRSNVFSSHFRNLINNNDMEHLFIGTRTPNVYDGLNVFINNTTAADSSAAKTWLKNNGVVVYYVLNTPTTTEITDATLKSQLEALRNAESYEGQTNISQVNDDLPFIITASAIKDLSNL